MACSSCDSRFNKPRVAQRITYSVQPEQKMIITLTTFRKTKDNERREVGRARQAKADYEKESKL